MLLTTAEDRATLRSDLGAVCGDFKAESDAARVALFCCLHKPPLSAENHNALNLGAQGRAPQTSINGNAEGFSSPVRKYLVPSIDVDRPVRRRKAKGFLFPPLFLHPLLVSAGAILETRFQGVRRSASYRHLTVQSMTLPHGNRSVNKDVVRVVDDSVHDRFGDRVVVIGVWIDSFVPSRHIELRAEDRRFCDLRPRAVFITELRGHVRSFSAGFTLVGVFHPKQRQCHTGFGQFFVDMLKIRGQIIAE